MGNAHFSNVKPVLVKHSEIYTLPSERKTHINTLQFKSFWGCGDLFSKRSRVVLPFVKRGSPGHSSTYSSSINPKPAASETGSENTSAPASLPGPAFSRIERMISDLISADATIITISFSSAIEIL